MSYWEHNYKQHTINYNNMLNKNRWLQRDTHTRRCVMHTWQKSNNYRYTVTNMLHKHNTPYTQIQIYPQILRHGHTYVHTNMHKLVHIHFHKEFERWNILLTNKHCFLCLIQKLEEPFCFSKCLWIIFNKLELQRCPQNLK